MMAREVMDRKEEGQIDCSGHRGKGWSSIRQAQKTILVSRVRSPFHAWPPKAMVFSWKFNTVIPSHQGHQGGDAKCGLSPGIRKDSPNLLENGFLSPDKLSWLENILPERKEVKEVDERDKVELDPKRESWCHDQRWSKLSFSVRPSDAAGEWSCWIIPAILLYAVPLPT